MARYSSLPPDVLQALWRHGIEDRTIRVPARDARHYAGRRREIVADLLVRAEALVEEKQDASPDAVRAAWESVRAEASRHGVSVASMYEAIDSATRNIGRWWSGERSRIRELRSQADGNAALTEYRRAKRHLSHGRDAPGVALDILTMASESIASAWWRREPPTQAVVRELLSEAICLAFLRQESCDVRRAAVVAGARQGLTPAEVDALEKDVEAGVLMAQAAVHAAGRQRR